MSISRVARVQYGQELAQITAHLNDHLGWYTTNRCYVGRHVGLRALRDMFFSSLTLTYTERFRLTVFLLWNGVSPYHVQRWYHLRGLLRDYQAHQHVQSLIDEWNGGCIRWIQRNYWTWCCHNDCWWDIGTDTPHQFPNGGVFV